MHVILATVSPFLISTRIRHTLRLHDCHDMACAQGIKIRASRWRDTGPFSEDGSSVLAEMLIGRYTPSCVQRGA